MQVADGLYVSQLNRCSDSSNWLSFIEVDRFIVLNATSSNISAISWRLVLVVEEIGLRGENHRP